MVGKDEIGKVEIGKLRHPSFVFNPDRIRAIRGQIESDCTEAAEEKMKWRK